MQKFAIAVHGGAGTILRQNMTLEKEQGYIQAMQEALDAGYSILERGGSALDAVEASAIQIENNPHFNAGRGSVFTHEGNVEMDASIMDGKSLGAGAVAGIRHIKNPVVLARAVMEQSEHVFLFGRGAEAFAKEVGFEFVPNEYFYTDYRLEQLNAIRGQNRAILDHNVFPEQNKFGTGGAVALDQYGNLAAATTTGGMTNKRFGRIGDSPVIGAGVYANNNTVAVSCTGHGEYFIKAVVAYDVSCLMEYKGFTLAEACDYVVNKKLTAISGEGGLIAIDKFGNVELVFNSDGMYRAFRCSDQPAYFGIYRD